MRDLSRVLVSLTVGASLVLGPGLAVAAPADDPDATGEPPPAAKPEGGEAEAEAPEDAKQAEDGETEAEAPEVDATAKPDTDEPPLDRSEPPLDRDEPPLDRSEPPLDRDEPPLDTDEPPLDTDEPPLDTDEPPPPTLGDELDTDEGLAIDDGYEPLRDSPEALNARRWLGAGIAATATGAVLVGGAVAMGLSQPCDPGAGNNCFDDARDRAALTMGVPGGVLLLGGVAMTSFGAVQKRRLVRRFTASVSLGRDQLGVFVAGQF